jgi:dienelactone hydrolase
MKNSTEHSRVARPISAVACAFLIGTVVTQVAASGESPMEQRYERAVLLTPWNAKAAIRNADLRVQWSADGRLLWHVLAREDGHDIVVREAETGRIRHRAALSEALAGWALITGRSVQPEALDSGDAVLLSPSGELELSHADSRYRCPLTGGPCLPREGRVAARSGDVVSPDGRRAAFVRDFNLWWRDLSTGRETQLTRDGSRLHPYATPSEQMRAVMLGVPSPSVLPAAVIWSPDSTQLVTVRIDQSRVQDYTLVEHVPRDSLLPRAHTFKYNFLTQPERVMQELLIVDIDDMAVRPVALPPESLISDTSVLLRRIWWRSDGAEFALGVLAPSEQFADVYKVDPRSGIARRLLREEAPYRVRIASELGPAPAVHLLPDGDLIWFSERDGIGSLYLIDGGSGLPKRRLTPDSTAVHRLLYVDEPRRVVYYSAGGPSQGPDAYRAAVYSVRLAGAGVRRLTLEPADHTVESEMIGFQAPTPQWRLGFAPGGRHFVSTHSTPVRPEVTVLRRADGRVIAELARAAVSPAIAAFRRDPESFVVSAPEGGEGLHGVMYFPADFDPARKYPVVDAIYNGQQVAIHPRTFSGALLNSASTQALAELGFIVVQLDARGTPLRSSAFLDFAARSRDQVESIGDHVHAIRMLAASRPYLDLERVAVVGNSNGGYAAMRAMLAYPDFFKVGVVANGSHDLRKYLPHGGENWIQKSLDADFESALKFAANQEHVAALRGNLLLIVGGMDANVPMANSFGVAQALIDAGKDFDMVVVPRMGHGFGRDPFAVRKQWAFLVRHLLGRELPAGDR